MARLAGWAKSKFGGDTVPQPVKGLMQPIDVDALANELALAARGNEAGARVEAEAEPIAVSRLALEPSRKRSGCFRTPAANLGESRRAGWWVCWTCADDLYASPFVGATQGGAVDGGRTSY